MTDDEFKAIQSATGVRISYPAKATLTPANEEPGLMAENQGIPDTDWERQARALDDEGCISVIGPAA
jgi:hypothetical protein